MATTVPSGFDLLNPLIAVTYETGAGHGVFEAGDMPHSDTVSRASIGGFAPPLSATSPLDVESHMTPTRGTREHHPSGPGGLLSGRLGLRIMVGFLAVALFPLVVSTMLGYLRSYRVL